MEKNFDAWNDYKKQIDISLHNIEFHPREIWWCSIGINVGREQQSDSSNYSRPVLIFRRFTRDIFWGIPLTTKIKEDGFRLKIFVKNSINDLLILQMRAYDRKRLVRKIGVLGNPEFIKIRQFIRKIT